MVIFSFFFFNDTATTEIYTVSDTLSLHDALPICASFGPKAPAIAMAGRPLIKDQPKAKSPGHGAPWQRDRGSARHRDAPSFAAARPHENLTAGAPFTLNANLQAQLAPLAAGFRERVANTAKKQRAGRHPRR